MMMITTLLVIIALPVLFPLVIVLLNVILNVILSILLKLNAIKQDCVELVNKLDAFIIKNTSK